MIRWLPRLLFLVVLVLGLRLLFNYFQQPEESGWREYVYVDDRFAIQFPSQPTITKELFGLDEPDELKFHSYISADEEGRGYAVIVVHYLKSVNTDRPDFLLQVAYQMLQIERENLLRSVREAPVGPYKGFVFTIRDNEGVSSYQAVQRGETVFLISHVDTLLDYNPQRFEQFRQTFRLNI